MPEIEVAALDELVARAPAAELPNLVGLLARLQAMALARLAAPLESSAAEKPALRCFTVQEAAEILALPVTRVYGLVRQRKLPAIREGKYVRIPAAALGEHIQGSTVPATPAGGRRR